MHIPRQAKLLFTVDDGWNRYLQAQYGHYWKVHFAKKTLGAWHSVKYLGCYLKRPPVSASPGV